LGKNINLYLTYYISGIGRSEDPLDDCVGSNPWHYRC